MAMDISGMPDCRGGLPQMNRFLETCLLLLLTGGSAHGYALLEMLPVFGFDASELNASTLYRALRKLESDGMVVSEWEAGGIGPPRRVYVLTDAGRSHLCQWIEVVRERRSRLEKLIGEFERRFPADGSRPCMERDKPGNDRKIYGTESKTPGTAQKAGVKQEKAGVMQKIPDTEQQEHNTR